MLLKKSYKAWGTLETFFTGGQVSLLPGSEHIVCPCSETVKIVSLKTGAPGTLRSGLQASAEVHTCHCPVNPNFAVSGVFACTSRKPQLASVLLYFSWTFARLSTAAAAERPPWRP